MTRTAAPSSTLLPAKVILHVGTAKAGSTAIQNALDAQYDTLLAQGILFPRSILRRSNASDHTRTPGHLDLLDSNLPTPLLDELESHAGRIDTLLLSIENLFHYPNKKNLEKLADFLAGRDLHMIAILRDQINWLESFYYETVVGGIRNETQPPSVLTQDLLARGVLTYESRLTFLENTFNASKVSVLPYRDACSDLTLLERFTTAARFRLPDSAQLGTARVNISQRFAECIEAHRRLNPLVARLSRQDSQQFSETMKTHYAALHDAGELTEDTSCLPQTLRRRVALTCASENRNLSNRFLTGQSLGLERTAAHVPTASNETVIAKIFDYGIETLATYSDDGRELHQLHCLTPLINDAHVIMTLGWDTPLALAAAKTGKLAIAVQPHQSARVQCQLAHDTARLPGKVIALAHPPTDPDFDAIWRKPWFRTPDIIFLRSNAEERLSQLARVLCKPTIIVIDGSEVINVTVPTECTCQDMTQTGRFTYFRLHPPARQTT